MIKKDFETFIYIGAEKILICVFSKIDSKILYKKESKFIELNNHIDQNKIFNFLSDNIFRVEKKLNQFINDINLIVDSKQFQSVDISIKQNIYSEITKKNHMNILNDLKNYVQDNYLNYSIIHFFVNHYLYDNNIKKNFVFLKKCNYFCLDATFILLNKEDILFYKKIFKRFQISLEKIICAKYIFDYFQTNEFNECEMGMKILSGHNPNEVFLIKKSIEKKEFFERFFNFFN